jgi:hypothetical protein
MYVYIYYDSNVHGRKKDGYKELYFGIDEVFLMRMKHFYNFLFS